ncbi:hypothetical protein [Ralstonia syzygii]|uniref:hypothetical protein n=1 Tax=Ralstonia syzygii TaxID=28097 RepID=UPI0018D05F2D|nr:hypothetical protein [Ralstonia syzygii]
MPAAEPPSGAIRPDAAQSAALSEAAPLFANVQAAVADLREDARAKARQIVAQAEDALLESLRALHAAETTGAVASSAAQALHERGAQ